MVGEREEEERGPAEQEVADVDNRQREDVEEPGFGQRAAVAGIEHHQNGEERVRQAHVAVVERV